MTDDPSTQSVVLCEGYHDRAFWAGWLKTLGWFIPAKYGNQKDGYKVVDPAGKKVIGGQFRILQSGGKVRTGHAMPR